MPLTAGNRLRGTSRTFLKEWREFRGLTQEDRPPQIAVMDRTNLSSLERGTDPYGQKILEAAAKALSVASQRTF